MDFLAALNASTGPTEEYSGFIGWVLNLMEVFGETGVGLAILLETFFPPIPSEAVLPAAGFMAYERRMSFWGAWTAATIGALLGAWIWYAIWIGMGYAFGPAIKPALEQWSGLLSNIVVGILAIMLGWFVIGRLRRIRKSGAETVPTEAR